MAVVASRHGCLDGSPVWEGERERGERDFEIIRRNERIDGEQERGSRLGTSVSVAGLAWGCGMGKTGVNECVGVRERGNKVLQDDASVGFR